jgi:MATE family multidrug resistance protein
MINLRGQLTSHQEGSVRELLAISLPLILSVLSTNIMSFFDRLILAQYDVHALNAAVVASFVFGFFQYAAVGIAAISEVFVGQFNGAKKFRYLGEPVWQMIWFSAMTACVFIPLGLFAGPYLIPNPEYVLDGIPYFKWLMIFGPAAALDAALSSFFIGRGQVKLVMTITILTNVINIMLDFMLIFGGANMNQTLIHYLSLLFPSACDYFANIQFFSGLGLSQIPAMGASGAAIATGIAQVVQCIILLIIFLSPYHRLNHGTGAWQFKAGLFFRSLKIGLPSAVSSIVELSAWCVLAQILTSAGESHITIYSIGESFFILFGFGFWGLQKGIISLVANYLGANRKEIVSSCLRSGIKLVLGIMLVFTIPLICYPNFLVEWFLNTDPNSMPSEELMNYGVSAIRWLWLYFMLDALAWLLSGVLTASGDTKFVMVMNSISSWFFCVIPIYIFVVYFEGSPVLAWKFSALYGLFNLICFSLRYRWLFGARAKEKKSGALHAFG